MTAPYAIYPAVPWLTRDRDEDNARRLLMTPLHVLLAAAENCNPGQLRSFAEYCTAAAKRLEARPAVLGQRTYPAAAMLLRELAARAESRALLLLRERRFVTVKGEVVEP